MALRIGGKKAPMPPVDEALRPEEEAPMPMPEEETMPEDMMAELPETLEEEPMMPEGGAEVDPIIAGYKGPENGPFACNNCVFFGRHGEGTCAIVSGAIDPEGICNMFTSKAGLEQAEPMPMDEEIPEPTEQEPEVEEASQEGY